MQRDKNLLHTNNG